ncbi:putative complex I intermediate-associated protein 30-like protein, partial [Leptotrombidium deliense]
MRSVVAALRTGNAFLYRKQIVNQCRCMTIYESSRKGSPEYDSQEKYDEWLKKPMTEKIRIKSQYLKKNVLLWCEEWKEKLRMDPKEVLPGDRDIQFKFNSQEECEKWIISADSDWNEGFTTGTLETSTAGYGVFHGKLDTSLPKSGNIVRAGWITMSFKCPKKSFNRPNTFDWDRYTHLIMRIRGDGRKYSLMIKTPGFFDIHWLDLKAYSLFTHG